MIPYYGLKLTNINDKNKIEDIEYKYRNSIIREHSTIDLYDSLSIGEECWSSCRNRILNVAYILELEGVHTIFTYRDFNSRILNVEEYLKNNNEKSSYNGCDYD